MQSHNLLEPALHDNQLFYKSTSNGNSSVLFTTSVVFLCNAKSTMVDCKFSHVQKRSCAPKMHLFPVKNLQQKQFLIKSKFMFSSCNRLRLEIEIRHHLYNSFKHESIYIKPNTNSNWVQYIFTSTCRG